MIKLREPAIHESYNHEQVFVFTLKVESKVKFVLHL